MKRLITTLCVLPGALALGSLARAHDPPTGHVNVSVYVGDKDQKPVDLTGMTAVIIIEPAGGKRQTVPLRLVSPGGSNVSGLGHGGEVREAGDMFVELVFEGAAHAAPQGQGQQGHGGDHGQGGHGGGHDQGGHGGDPGQGGHGAGGHGAGGGDHAGAGHGGGDDGGHGEGAGRAGAGPARFHADVNVTSYTCGMQGHPVADAPGRCSRCPMEMRPVGRQLTAVVVLRGGGRTVNARGFRYPSEVPTSYADGLERIQRHIAAIERLIQEDQLTRVHPVAEKISHVCQQLPQHAPDGKRAQVEATCRATVGLFNEIDEAADNNRKPETVAALEKYRAKLTELRGHQR